MNAIQFYILYKLKVCFYLFRCSRSCTTCTAATMCQECNEGYMMQIRGMSCEFMDCDDSKYHLVSYISVV